MKGRVFLSGGSEEGIFCYTRTENRTCCARCYHVHVVENYNFDIHIWICRLHPDASVHVTCFKFMLKSHHCVKHRRYVPKICCCNQTDCPMFISGPFLFTLNKHYITNSPTVLLHKMVYPPPDLSPEFFLTTEASWFAH